MFDFPSPVFYAEDPSLFPTVAHPGEDVGFDLRAAHYYHIEDTTVLVETGVKVWLPSAPWPFMFELQIRSRSGLAKQGIIVANQPGTIDPGFKDSIKVLLMNTHPDTHFNIEPGDRIAQAVFNVAIDPRYVERCTDIFEFQQLHSVYQDRGENGFGSSGI